ncbi:hypothetical protein VQ7734_03844 [Vibrio quintilis]|uniref:Uncharacterized protein n=1 Tax=Vibrio quintilis TaxID=1117707 RepID=A0A1M7YZQ4_9VIBR|nr:hypothetical protein VQ7734_03844 [Vibrio quintilis]
MSSTGPERSKKAIHPKHINVYATYRKHLICIPKQPEKTVFRLFGYKVNSPAHYMQIMLLSSAVIRVARIRFAFFLNWPLIFVVDFAIFIITTHNC